MTKERPLLPENPERRKCGRRNPAHHGSRQSHPAAPSSGYLCPAAHPAALCRAGTSHVISPRSSSAGNTDTLPASDARQAGLPYRKKHRQSVRTAVLPAARNSRRLYTCPALCPHPYREFHGQRRRMRTCSQTLRRQHRLSLFHSFHRRRNSAGPAEQPSAVPWFLFWDSSSAR